MYRIWYFLTQPLATVLYTELGSHWMSRLGNVPKWRPFVGWRGLNWITPNPKLTFEGKNWTIVEWGWSKSTPQYRSSFIDFPFIPLLRQHCLCWRRFGGWIRKSPKMCWHNIGMVHYSVLVRIAIQRVG